MKRLHHCLLFLPPRQHPRTPISAEISFFSFQLRCHFHSSFQSQSWHLWEQCALSMSATRQANRKRSAGEKPRQREGGEEEGGISGKKIKIKMTGKYWGGGSYDLGSYLPHLELWAHPVAREGDGGGKRERSSFSREKFNMFIHAGEELRCWRALQSQAWLRVLHGLLLWPASLCLAFDWGADQSPSTLPGPGPPISPRGCSLNKPCQGSLSHHLKGQPPQMARKTLLSPAGERRRWWPRVLGAVEAAGVRPEATSVYLHQFESTYTNRWWHLCCSLSTSGNT